MKTFVFITLCSLFLNISAHGGEDDFRMRESWVQGLKELLHEIEQEGHYEVVQREKKFIDSWTLIESAWADARYDCFYAGWPSTLKSSGGKKLCQLPIRTNSSYEKGVCKEGELQCQPLLFGKNLCVSFKTREERNRSFANCEEKFKKEKNGQHDFLKNLSVKEANDLRELSHLAGDICSQKNSSICQKIKAKLPDAMKAIDRSFVEATSGDAIGSSQEDAVEAGPVTMIATGAVAPSAEECDETPTQELDLLAQGLGAVQKKLNSSVDEKYEKIKAEFLASPFCDPHKVVNDSTDKPSAIYMSLLMNELKGVDYFNSDQQRESFLKKLQEKFNLSSTARSEVAPLLYGMNSSNRKLQAMKIKGLIVQDVVKGYNPRMKNLEPEMKEELAKKNIFKKDSQGNVECPFISKDAFMKALAGREEVLRAHGGSIKNKDQITIVDYTRPSNERRMFVIDLRTQEVLHNTWTAQGVGSDEGRGQDGKGSNPEMSNRPGSLRSSDGFIIATKAASGSRFGPNVLLKGIDSNNSKMAERAVIVHGWYTPMEDYTQGAKKFSAKKDQYGSSKDVVSQMMKTNFRSSSENDMKNALWDLQESFVTPSYLPPTEGCLGVPTVNLSHLDRKGRNKNQVELLREDLPGSIIFSYSGPGMKSKYL